MYTMRTDWHESRDITYVRKVFFVANTVDEMNSFSRSAGHAFVTHTAEKMNGSVNKKLPKGEIFK